MAVPRGLTSPKRLPQYSETSGGARRVLGTGTRYQPTNQPTPTATGFGVTGMGGPGCFDKELEDADELVSVVEVAERRVLRVCHLAASQPHGPAGRVLQPCAPDLVACPFPFAVAGPAIFTLLRWARWCLRPRPRPPAALSVGGWQSSARSTCSCTTPEGCCSGCHWPPSAGDHCAHPPADGSA